MSFSCRHAVTWMVVAAATGCAPSHSRQYELRGQVLAVDRGRLEITIKHEDIPRFMPAMTMPFKVREAALLEGRTPGDLVRATLVVEGNGAHLRAIEKTGAAPLTDAPPTPRPVDLLGPGDAVPDARLVDEQGRPRRFSDFRGRAVAVTFIYTRCPLPDFCPLMDRHFAALQRDIAADPALAGRVALLSISFDPAHDTPSVLAAHAARAGAHPDIWTFLTGPQVEIERVASAFGVSMIREANPAVEIVHNLRTAVVDPAGRLVSVVSGNDWNPRDLLADVRNALAR